MMRHKHDDKGSVTEKLADCGRQWSPPNDWIRITTIDAHTAGEPLRVILSGYPALDGVTILDRRRQARDEYDNFRTALMWEPRGHADMYGCVVTEPVTPGADFGVLFLHNEGYSSMCGHGIIAITKIAVEFELVARQEPETMVRIDTPAGLVTAYANVRDGVVESVRFQNVPAYVAELDRKVLVPGYGLITYDLAFGGAYYAYVDVEQVGLTCSSVHHAELIAAGKAIKKAVMADYEIHHPVEDDLGFLYGTIFIGPPEGRDAHSRNVCVFAEGEVDRSPTGTGVSGRLAIHYARGEVTLGQSCIIESIIGSRFVGRVIEETTLGSFPAVITEVEGQAHITGRHEFLADPNDPLRDGFILR
jgi:trans-L-3-hydroxyproline dehydratase